MTMFVAIVGNFEAGLRALGPYETLEEARAVLAGMDLDVTLVLPVLDERSPDGMTLLALARRGRIRW